MGKSSSCKIMLSLLKKESLKLQAIWDERLGGVPMMIKCAHIGIEEEPVVPEVRRYFLGHDQVLKSFDKPIYPYQGQPEMSRGNI